MRILWMPPYDVPLPEFSLWVPQPQLDALIMLVALQPLTTTVLG